MFTTISSETVLEGRVFSVRRDLLEAGGRRFVREVVVHPGAVAVIPVDEDGMLYLVRQYRHAVGGELVEVVAGTLEDESPRECALRELEEEAGFQASELVKLAEFYLAPGYSTELMHLFLARGLRRSHQRPDVDEKIKLLKTSLDEAVGMVLDGAIRDAKTIASLFIYRELAGRV